MPAHRWGYARIHCSVNVKSNVLFTESPKGYLFEDIVAGFRRDRIIVVVYVFDVIRK